MKKLLLAISGILLALGGALPAQAQQHTDALVVASCGSESLTAATYGYVTMDATGTLCTAGGGGGGGLSVVDGATFTPSMSSFTPSGGEYSATPLTLTSGKQGTLALNQYRAAFVDVMTSNNNLYAILNTLNTSVNAGVGTAGAGPPSNIIYLGGNAGGTNKLQGWTMVNPSGSIYAGQVDLASVGGAGVALGQTTKSASIPVTIASDQGATFQTPTPTAGQGCTPYHLSGGTTASTNSHSVKASAVATGCRWTLINTNASTLGYLKVYDSAGAPTCSSATGLVHVYPILAGPGGVQTIDAMGEAFANGIGYCVTGGGGDTDNTNAPTGIYIEGDYK